MVFFALSPLKKTKKRRIRVTPGIYNSRKTVCCLEEKFSDKDKRCLLAPRLNEIEFLSEGEMVSRFVREIGIDRLGDLSYYTSSRKT